MDNSNNEVPATEVEREDTGASVTTAPGMTPPSTPPATEMKRDTHETEASPTARPQPKPSRHILRNILVPLALLVVGAIAGVILYKLYLEPKTSTSSTSTTTSSTTSTSTTKLTAASLISTVKSRMKTPEVATTIDSSMVMARTADGKNGAFSVPYSQPTGYKFYTTPQVMAGFTVASSDSGASNDDAMTVRAYFAEQGLSSGSVNSDASNEIFSAADYVNGDVHCTVSQTTYSYAAGTYQVQVGCADVSSYKATAELITPLYNAYIAAHPEAAQEGLLLVRPDIKSSPVTGYQHATVSSGNIFAPVGGSAVLLYRTPDTTWHYFLNSQDEPLCTAYSTTDLKKAYTGESCALMNGQESKVTQ